MNLNIIFCQLNNSDKYLNVKLILHAFHIFRFYVHLIFVLYFVSRVVTYYYLLSICLDPDKFSCIWHFAFFFFFFFFMHASQFLETKCIVHAMFTHYSCTVHRTYNHFIQEKNIKNGSHGTIYTFKNYFATVFSVFTELK